MTSRLILDYTTLAESNIQVFVFLEEATELNFINDFSYGKED